MKSLTLVAALLVTLGSPCTLLAGAPYEGLDAGDVFVAMITRVEDKDATNARPPRVWLEVHEVLRGEAKVARSPALWSPFHWNFSRGAPIIKHRFLSSPALKGRINR